MQGSLRQQFISMAQENEILKEKLKQEKQEKAYLCTNVLDLKLSLRAHKAALRKQEKKWNRLKSKNKKSFLNLLKLS